MSSPNIFPTQADNGFYYQRDVLGRIEGPHVNEYECADAVALCNIAYLESVGSVTAWQRHTRRRFMVAIPGCWQVMTCDELAEFAENEYNLRCN